jgi:hypothetical protein
MSIFPRPKNYDIKFEMRIGAQIYCSITHKFGADVLQDHTEKTILTHSAVLYVKRFLNIVDKKQKQPMIDLLSEALGQQSINWQAVEDAAEQIVFHSLNQMQKNAQNDFLFKDGGALPGKLMETTIPDDLVWGKYEFYLVNRRGKWQDQFFMKMTHDKIILSRLVVLFLQYIDQQLNEDNTYHQVVLASIG